MRLYRKHTSFVRGIVLSLLFLAIYVVNDFNMMDGLLRPTEKVPTLPPRHYSRL